MSSCSLSNILTQVAKYVQIDKAYMQLRILSYSARKPVQEFNPCNDSQAFKAKWATKEKNSSTIYWNYRIII
jgi:hypothetical protein